MDKTTLTYDDVLASEGARFISRMNVYGFSYYCFQMNMLDLIQSLEQCAETAFAIEILLIENRQKKTKVFQEIIRRFHNAVAAAKSLVEHTRIFVREYYNNNNSITIAYNEKVAETFSKNGNAAIVEDLRNYFLHAGIPPVSMKSRVGSEIKHEIFLNIAALKSWGRLKSQSKVYLSNFEGDINLLPLVKEYGATVESFHIWFSNFLQKHHAKDIEYAYALEASIIGIAPKTND